MTDHNNSTARGYDRRWRKLRVRVLQEEPTCRMCRQVGRTREADTVDHIQPKRDGGTDVRSNLQSLCRNCHNSIKATLERTGELKGCDTTGEPLDPAHHWRN